MHRSEPWRDCKAATYRAESIGGAEDSCQERGGKTRRVNPAEDAARQQLPQKKAITAFDNLLKMQHGDIDAHGNTVAKHLQERSKNFTAEADRYSVLEVGVADAGGDIVRSATTASWRLKSFNRIASREGVSSLESRLRRAMLRK
jgi:hypothetical protein